MPRQLMRVLDHADAHLGASLERLFELIRIPSISMDQAFAGECRRAAECIAGQLTDLGFQASMRETSGHPIVKARHQGPPGAPHFLFYGHYDVQPPGTSELWRSPPFEPTLVDQDGEVQIVGRGASDDKGALMTFLEACRAWIKVTGGLPVGVTIILEGEEEIGSPGLRSLLAESREELGADAVFVCDTEMWGSTQPGITVMLRGLVGDEVQIKCADRDLHSGLFGGAARNALHVLTGVLASLDDAQGRVAIPGFYDGVGEPPEALREQWSQLTFDERAFLGNFGLRQSAGEAGYSLLEQIWARPTCEINGVIGGHTGAGLMTVIPAEASAKVSFRLVEGQDPHKIRKAFRDFVDAQVPPDCKVMFHGDGGSEAVVIPLDGPWLQHTRAALMDEWEQEAALIGMGGSIPIVTDIRHLLNMEVIMVGFARADNRIHAPNEKYDLSSFRKGIFSWIRILSAGSQNGS